MVYKVSKAGVRSGNTLRNLHSGRTKRYLRQACFIGRSNLRPKEVPKFLDSATEDDFVNSTLRSTNVLLSLNKKERWNIPATVSHMIKDGAFEDGKTMVSLLERHNLKRRANCVSFVCNTGRVRHVIPSQKKYFNFKQDNNDSDESNRQKRRRQKEEEMNTMKTMKLKARRDKKDATIKTVHAFTLSGMRKVDETRTCSARHRPEYHLEVYYPCPKSCSLTYNPKYTDAHMEFDQEGKMEIKSNSKPTKLKRRHRKRFTSKDLREYEEDMGEIDAYDSWSDYYEPSDSEFFSDTESNVSYQESDGDCERNTGFNENSDCWNETELKRSKFSDNILASLIAQAENARSLCENVKPQQRKKSSRNHALHHSLSDAQNKSHIVYESKENLNSKPTNDTAVQSKSTNDTAVQSKSTNDTAVQSKSANDTAIQIKMTEAECLTLESARVIITSTETEPDKLRSRFGLSYSEAESEPRRFLINVTEDVQNLLCSSRSAQQTSMYMSYLVFIHDGVYDEGLDTFKVIFNSNICTETLRVSESIPFERTSIEEIMNRVISVLLDMKQDNLIVLRHCSKVPSCPASLHIDILGVAVKTFRTSDEISRASQTSEMQEKTDYSCSLNNFVRNLDADMFCDICYENINPTQTEAVPGTRLARCGHNFCDECWRSHFRNKVKNGAVKIVCPGYDCDVNVGPATLLSLLHISEVSQLFQRACEEKEESNPSSKWCPNPDCGRIIKLENMKETVEVSVDVTCACGHEFCFCCLSQPHWPAKCDQAEEYQGSIEALKRLKESTEERSPSDLSRVPSSTKGKKKTYKIVEIEGRICPQCSKFIEKDGGCHYVRCRCGFVFCWECMNDAKSHWFCDPVPSFIAKFAVNVKIRHLVIPKLFSNGTEEIFRSKSDGTRIKATLFQKAVQQRLEDNKLTYHNEMREIVKKIGNISQKDLQLKAEFLILCGVDTEHTDDACKFNQLFQLHVSKFLLSCGEIKKALRHVTEFTFVLLQDTPDSLDKRRTLRLANDLSGYCCFIASILELGQNQDVLAAIRRLADIKIWARRALTTLMYSVDKLRR